LPNQYSYSGLHNDGSGGSDSSLVDYARDGEAVDSWAAVRVKEQLQRRWMM
jgi:hypothetical protein